MAEVSVIIPAHNEAGAILETIAGVQAAFDGSEHDCEVILVDDGSHDETASMGRSTGVRVISHPTRKGYGNALLTGIRNASHPWIAITDSDGTYPVEQLPCMLERALEGGFDMVVGHRQFRQFRESRLKRCLRAVFGGLIRFVVGEKVPDINSGLRVIKRDMLDHFASVLSGSFSFTTSITIIAFQTGRHLLYWPVEYFPRKGRSHVRLFRDSLRALQIVTTTILLFNPIKLFLVMSLAMFLDGLVGAIVVFLAPAAFPSVLIFSLGLFASGMLLGIGLIAMRMQLGILEVALPRRGYSPSPGTVGEEPSNGHSGSDCANQVRESMPPTTYQTTTRRSL